VDSPCFLTLFFLSVALEEIERGCEETTCGEGEEDDGVAIGSLGCWWGGGGVVEALGAALGLSWRGGQRAEEQREGERYGESKTRAPKSGHDASLFWLCWLKRRRFLLAQGHGWVAKLRVKTNTKANAGVLRFAQNDKD
jgi:hypothetical protein